MAYELRFPGFTGPSYGVQDVRVNYKPVRLITSPPEEITQRGSCARQGLRSLEGGVGQSPPTVLPK